MGVPHIRVLCWLGWSGCFLWRNKLGLGLNCYRQFLHLKFLFYCILVAYSMSVVGIRVLAEMMFRRLWWSIWDWQRWFWGQGHPSVDVSDAVRPRATSAEDDDAEVLIECRNVYKSFGEKHILRGASFKVFSPSLCRKWTERVCPFMLPLWVDGMKDFSFKGF